MDPDRFVHKTITFPGPTSRLAGLDVALQSIEDLLTHARAQNLIRLEARLKQYGNALHPDDVEDEMYDVERINDQLLPKVLIGGFIVVLWSVFESCVKDLAEYTKNEKQGVFGLEELRAGDFLGQIEKFFERMTGMTVFPEHDIRRQLEELKSFRNTLVHSDGNTKDLPKGLRAKSSAEYRSRNLFLCSDLHHKYVVPNIEFAKLRFTLINDFLLEFAERLYKELHPRKLS